MCIREIKEKQLNVGEESSYLDLEIFFFPSRKKKEREICENLLLGFRVGGEWLNL